MGLDSNQIAQVAASVDWQTLAVNHGWVTADAMAKLVEQFNAGEIATVFQNVGYNQLYLASLVNENTLPAITAALGEGTRVFVMNFDFLGLDLAMLPTWKIWEHLNWQYIGAFLLIVISAFSSIFMSKISMKTNQMNNQSGQRAGGKDQSDHDVDHAFDVPVDRLYDAGGHVCLLDRQQPVLRHPGAHCRKDTEKGL